MTSAGFDKPLYIFPLATAGHFKKRCSGKTAS